MVNVTLVLDCVRSGAGTGTTYDVHRLTKGFGSGGSGAGVTRPGAGGEAAENGDPTWSHNRFPSAFWTNIGGDFINTPSASFPSGCVTVRVSSMGLVQDVQAWVDGTEQDGFLIKTSNEGISQTGTVFRSSESTGQKPELIVDFISASTSPLPSVTLTPTPTPPPTSPSTTSAVNSPTTFTDFTPTDVSSASSLTPLLLTSCVFCFFFYL